MSDTTDNPATTDVRPQPPQPTGKAQFIDTKSFVFWVMIVVGLYSALHLFPELTSSEFIKLAPANAWLAFVQWSIYGAIFLTIVYTHQLFVRRSPWVTLVALAWGGFVATWFSSKATAATEDIFTHWFALDFNDRWGSAIAAATNEEVLKTLGLVALVLLPLAGVRSMLDGWFYGMMVGLGFQLVEDYLYTTQNATDRYEVFAFLIQRGLFSGLWAHAVYGGIIGAGIGYFVSRKDQPMPKRLGVAIGLFAIVWLFHFAWDTDFINEFFGDSGWGFLGVILLKGLPALVVLLLVVRWGRTTERAIWSDFVAQHIDRSLVPAEDATALLHRRTRRAARHEAGRVGGHHAAQARKHLQLAQLRYVQSVIEEGTNCEAAAENAANIRELQAIDTRAAITV